MDVVVDEKTYEKSKISAVVIARVAEKLSRDLDQKKIRKNKKWTETVNMDGEKFVVMCREEDGKVVIRNIRYAKKRKVRAR